MNLIEMILGGIITVGAGIISLYLKSVEERVRKVKEEVATKPSRDEVEKLVDLKQEAHKVAMQDIKEDLKRLETKLDKLIEKL